LKQAIATPSVWPAFQPLVDLQGGALIGFEVLARWTDPVAGVIPPSDFVPYAEANGLIDALTAKIMREACDQAVSWPGDFVLAFNLSPTQFRNPDLSDLVIRTVTSTGFPLSRIHIEITESALLEDDETVRQTIARLKAAGFGLALDDFGTGFASLTQLHAFPFDRLKIDMSFVRRMEEDSGSRKIIASVIGLGQSLGMTVVAEGVETEEQAAILRKLGCDVGQGWLFGKPLRAAETAKYLATQTQKAPSPRANGSLFQRVHQLDALYKAAPIGLCFLDTDLRFISVNQRYAEMLGSSPADMVGLPVHDVMPDRDARHLTRDFRRILAGETVVVDEFKTASAASAFLIINQRVDDDAGNPIGISVTAIDITDRKLIEGALQETEDHARWSIELSPNIPWSSDPDGTVNFMGPTPDGAIVSVADRITDWQMRMHPDDRPRVRQEWLTWIPSGKPFETTFRMRLNDETWRWMLSRARPHHDAKGEILRWYGLISEMAVQDQVEGRAAWVHGHDGDAGPANAAAGREQARADDTNIKGAIAPPPSPAPASTASSETGGLSDALLVSMLMRMFEFAPIAMSITTSDTKTSSYLKVNEAYLRLTGLKWEAIQGKKLTSEGAAIDNPARDRRHRLLETNGSYEQEEVEIAYADGTIIPTLISAQRTVIEGMSFDVEVIIDVSARVRQQREIESALKTSARTDALSGLPNRASFDEALRQAVARNLQNDRKLALAYIDLNKFKVVNDTLGHSAGDEVLRIISSRLRENFRATDFIARIGGDEFVVMLDIDRKLAGDLQPHLQKTMERIFKPIPIGGQVTFTGAAVGVTFLQEDDTAQTYVDRADEYMYIAKTTGERVAVVCFGQILEPSQGSPPASRAGTRPS
jgi:diguanylate cyclase (GGDEF)-like protein/PAS domain S-box-containing protein